MTDITKRGLFRGSWSFPVANMTKIGNADVVTTITPGFAGRIIKWFWVQGTAASTPAKAATLTPYVGSVAITNNIGTSSTIALTSAACTPLGKVIEGSAIGGGTSYFNSTSTISITASAVTAFSEGAGTIIVEYEGKVL